MIHYYDSGRQKETLHTGPRLFTRHLLTALFLLCGASSFSQSLANYTVARTTGQAYNSIAATGTSPSAIGNWRSGNTATDNNLSAALPIGFTFYYNGVAYTQFSMSTNGFLTFNTGTTETGFSFSAYGYDNNYFAQHEGTLIALAPFYDNLATAANANTAADLNAGFKFLTTGSPGSRILTVEWINTQDTSSTSTSSFNFQVVLYEADSHIEFNYGVMTFSNSGSLPIMTYTTGINGSNLAGQTPANLLTLQAANGTAFSNTPQSSLGWNVPADMPQAGSRYTFSPRSPSPANPTSLSFTGVAGGSTTLNWVDNSTNESYFIVTRATDAAFTTNVLATIVNSATSGATGGACSVTQTGLFPGTLYYYRVVAANEGSAPSAPGISGTQFTAAAATYRWVGVGTTGWGTPGNWSPARTNPQATDILIVENGTASVANGFTGQTIGKLVIRNSSTFAIHTGSLTAALTIGSDGTAADEMFVEFGSTFRTNGTVNSLTLAFTSGATASIGGRFEIDGSTKLQLVDLANCTMTITATGRLVEYGTTDYDPFGQNGAASLIVTGIYEHALSTVGGTIPRAVWNTGSTCQVTGLTSASAAPARLNQSFYDLVWNCPSQSNAITIFLPPTAVSRNFAVSATGSGRLGLSGTTLSTLNFLQSGGSFRLESSSGTTVLQVAGSFTQSGGTMHSGTGGSGTAILHFNGTSQQSVSFFNTAPTGDGITYRVSNPAGIILSGTGTLNSTFNIGPTGGIRLSVAAAAPISTSLTFVYAQGATLTYDAAASMTATTLEFPELSGPSKLVVNVGAGNAVVLPFSRSLAPAASNGVLTLSSGDIDLGAQTLTLGTSPALPGTLNYTSGLIRLTSGSFRRWFPTTGLPTSAGTGIGFFPIAFGTANRSVQVFLSATNGLSTGGCLAASHTDAAGITGVDINDGATELYGRSNASWTLTPLSGMTLSGAARFRLRLTAGGVDALSGVSTAATNLRITQEASIAGTHANSAYTAPNFTVTRLNLSLSDLGNTQYIGLPCPSADAGTIIPGKLCGIGSSATFVSTGDPGGSWSSSDPDIATVDPVSGLVTVTGNGTAVISYTATRPEGCSAVVATIVTDLGTTIYSGGTWSNGAPTESVAAVISSSFTATEDLTACALTVNNNATVTVGSVDLNGEPLTGYDFTIDGPVTVTSGALVFEQGSNLVQSSYTGANSGHISVKTNVKIWRQDYVYWGSPVTGQNLFNFSPLTLDTRFYVLDAPTNTFDAVFQAPGVAQSKATYAFEPTTGYMVRAPNTFVNPNANPALQQLFTGTFKGVPNNGTFTFSIPATATATHLIANPYPSTISAAEFLNYNPGTISFWTHTSQEAGTNNYATMNYFGAVQPSDSGVVPNGSIQVGQGFIFLNQYGLPSVTFYNVMRTGDNQGQFFRSAESDRSRVWLNLRQGDTEGNQMMFGYTADATLDADGLYDGRSIGPGNQISTLIGADRYVIQARPAFTLQDVVPMGFHAISGGTFTIALDHVDGLFEGDQDIFLMDSQTGVITNLKNAAYTFASEAGDFDDRFRIQYTNSALGIWESEIDPVVIYKDNGILNIDGGSAAISEVRIFDVRGRLLYDRNAIDATTLQLTELRPAQEVLLVQVTTRDDGRIVTKKIVY